MPVLATLPEAETRRGLAEVGPESALLRIHAALMQGEYLTSAESRRDSPDSFPTFSTANLIDASGGKVGQAATFAEWQPLVL